MTRLVEVTNGFPDTRIRDYRTLTPPLYKKIQKLSRRLCGLSVIHINATRSGGGVAELLQSQIPLERSIGIKSRWLVIEAPEAFFNVTKKIHNLLQGHPGVLSPREHSRYISTCGELSASLRSCIQQNNLARGIIVLHDPQPLPIAHSIPNGWRSVSRLHIDLSTPNPVMLELLRPFIAACDGLITSSDAYTRVFPERRKKHIRIILPAIDPFSPKNNALSPEAAHTALLAGFPSFHLNRPSIAQVSRFDPWKDPLGVLDAYYRAKNTISDLQLILAGSFAGDDPEGARVFKTIKKHACGDPDIFLWTEEDPLLVNAIQTASDLIVQKSIREGFGLTIAEAMWKGKAVIAGNTAGAHEQISDHKNGIIVSSPEETARAIVALLAHPRMRAALGKAARASVKKRFLMSRFIYDHCKAYRSFFEAV